MNHSSKGSLDRRGFMAGLGGSLGTLAALGGAKAAQAQAPRAVAAQPKGALIERTLGRTGIRLPVVSMGVMNATVPTLVSRSYELGVRLFDTAWFYQRGLNESMVGDMVKELGCRDKVTIATKIYLKEAKRDLYTPEIKALFLQRFEESLKRLKTDYVDILYYHAADDVREIQNPPILEAFEELKSAGKVRFRGVSCHRQQNELVEDMTRSRFYDVALVILKAAKGADERSTQVFEAAAKSGIGLIAMKTQCGGGGFWAQRTGEGGEIKDLNHPALLKWVLHRPYITTAIPGYTTFEQMEESVGVAHALELTPPERAFLEREQIRLAESFCVQCDACRGQCPHGVDVPTLMRTHMYAYGYRNLELALATHGTLAHATGVQACGDCSVCRVRCPRQVDVAGRVARVRQLVGAYA